MFAGYQRKINFICVALLMVVSISSCQNSREILKFGIDYSKVSVNSLKGYDMVVLEPFNYNYRETRQLLESKTKLIGYVSLGEVGASRWYYPLLKDKGLLLGKNENWDSYFINLTDTLSRRMLLNKVIPEIMDRGFDGLFLDTIDDVAPGTGRGNMQGDMVQLIREIRKRYPDIYIIQNRGMFLLNQTHKYVNALLIEDVASSYNFDQKKYYMVDDSTFKKRIENIDHYEAEINSGQLLLVDYATSDSLKKQVQQRLDTLKLPYFISSIKLDTLPPVKN